MPDRTSSVEVDHRMFRAKAAPVSLRSSRQSVGVSEEGSVNGRRHFEGGRLRFLRHRNFTIGSVVYETTFAPQRQDDCGMAKIVISVSLLDS